MNMIDSMLDGDEPIVQIISADAGPMTASEFVSEFNNGCMQMAMFEDAYAALEADGFRERGFFAPLSNMSRSQEH